MTDLRRALRQQGVYLKVVKNRLARLAADAASRQEIKAIINGPTAVAYGFDDPVGPAKILADYIDANKLSLTIKGGVMGARSLTSDEINRLASLPGRDELISLLLSRMQSPITGLANVIQGPVEGLARVLHQIASTSTADSETKTIEKSVSANETDVS